MILGHLLWTPRMSVDNSSLLPLATAGTRLSASVLRGTRCLRQSWSRRTEGTGDRAGCKTWQLLGHMIILYLQVKHTHIFLFPY